MMGSVNFYQALKSKCISICAAKVRDELCRHFIHFIHIPVSCIDASCIDCSSENADWRALRAESNATHHVSVGQLSAGYIMQSNDRPIPGFKLCVKNF